MSLWFAALLGIVQGLTEFLPISSTAHLRIVPALLGQGDPGAAFTAVIQLGTLIAVVGYFARELFYEMPRALLFDRSRPEARTAVHLVIGTIPIAIAGVLGKDYVTGPLRSLWVISAALAAVAAIMFLADRHGAGDRKVHDLTWKDALLIGIAQAGALVPGVSRSGATITCALVIGMARPQAARFSFLLGVPAIAGAGIFEMKDAVAQLGPDAVSTLAVGTACAAVSGYLSIAWLIRFLGRRTLAGFCLYRVALAVLLAALMLSGVVAANA